MQFTVTGLNAATNYAYSITAKAEEGDVIASYSGTFDTSGAPQGMDELNANSQAIKLLLNGQILILRGDKTYTIHGTAIK